MSGLKNLCKKILQLRLTQTRQISTQNLYREVSIEVPWGHVAGKWWGPSDARPILALHGWQDNCATFDRLIPLLNNNVSFLCIDLPGHGRSSHLPPGMLYFFLNYVVLIRYLAKYFQWQKVSLMGHSVGGAVSYIYAALYPENVDFMLSIDALKPLVRKNYNNLAGQTIDDFFKYASFANKEPPSYDIEDIKQRTSRSNNNSIKYEYSRIVMERNIAPSKSHPGKYYLTRDPRVKTGGLDSFTQEQLIEYAQYITCPIFIAKAKQASYYEDKSNFYEVLDVLKRSSKDLNIHYVDGTHHVHLNNPEKISRLMNEFIDRHNGEDRSMGGIRETVVINI